MFMSPLKGKEESGQIVPLPTNHWALWFCWLRTWCWFRAAEVRELVQGLSTMWTCIQCISHGAC